MTESHKLLSLLGRDRLEALISEYGGTNIYVPKRVPDPHRDNHIRVMFSDSLKAGTSTMSSYLVCSREYGLSLRRVQEIVAEAK